MSRFLVDQYIFSFEIYTEHFILLNLHITLLGFLWIHVTIIRFFCSSENNLKMALIKTMSILLGITILAILIKTPLTEGNPITDCWDTWSRCSRWSSPVTGILWQSCEDRCRCKGYATGTCMQVPSKCPLTSKAWQCQCSGKLSGRKPIWCGF